MRILLTVIHIDDIIVKVRINSSNFSFATAHIADSAITIDDHIARIKGRGC